MSTVTVTLPVLPLEGAVVLPHTVITIALESDEAKAAVEAATANESDLLLVPRRDGRYAKVGVIGSIDAAGELPNGQKAIVVRGVQRAVIGTGVSGPGAALWVEVEPVEPDRSDDRVNELAREYRATVTALLEQRGADHLAPTVAAIDDPSVLADTIAQWPELAPDRRTELLETLSTSERLQMALRWAKEALADGEIKQRIRHDVTEGMEKQQREYLLRQQLSAIRKELTELTGSAPDGADAASDYRTRVQEAALPEAARAAAEREIDRLERMSEQNPEQSWIRTWLDTLLELPWGNRSDDQLDVSAARSTLDEYTTGLDEAKDRIVEWLAVRKLRADRGLDGPGPTGGDAIDHNNLNRSEKSAKAGATVTRRNGAIIALVGPPGVGKTSLGESVARALGRKFTRVALGGVRDEAEIRGHRRTYVGAQPGRLVRALREAGTMNPVILLDEIDKLATGWSGDPAAALLEVLDPAQNHTFRDHYLEVDLDLSDVVFLATANTLDSIPAPLLDRMEIVSVDGYTDLEKVAIGRKHLLPRQLATSGLRPDEVTFTDAALRRIVEGYTREAGVRGLERQLAKALRKIAMQVAGQPAMGGSAGNEEARTTDEAPANSTGETTTSDTTNEAEAVVAPGGPHVVDSDEDVKALLGRPKRIIEEVASRVAIPGVATGLAVTGAGGDVLFVETSSMPSAGDETQLTVTGQLGDVMKESASIALSYVRAHATELGIDLDNLKARRLHVHFPAGAVPKDGPSAGITMTTALVSLLTNRAVNATVAMTGEVTLQGHVLPIGGLKQKLLAAHRAGLTTVIIPAANEPDLDDVPEQIRAGLSIHPVAEIADVLRIALSA